MVLAMVLTSSENVCPDKLLMVAQGVRWNGEGGLQPSLSAAKLCRLAILLLSTCAFAARRHYVQWEWGLQLGILGSAEVLYLR